MKRFRLPVGAWVTLGFVALAGLGLWLWNRQAVGVFVDAVIAFCT